LLYILLYLPVLAFCLWIFQSYFLLILQSYYFLQIFQCYFLIITNLILIYIKCSCYIYNFYLYRYCEPLLSKFPKYSVNITPLLIWVYTVIIFMQNALCENRSTNIACMTNKLCMPECVNCQASYFISIIIFYYLILLLHFFCFLYFKLDSRHCIKKIFDKIYFSLIEYKYSVQKKSIS
jgi:hypothetical protein